MKLKDKIAVVSGASRGIGRAVALDLARNGCDVCFNYLNSKEAAEKLCKEIASLGRQVRSYQVDITDYNAVKHMVTEIEDNLGDIDILINNAGITADSALAMMSPESWHRVIDTNLNGTFNLTRSVIVSLMKRRAGTIINMASISGITGNARQTNYSASKGAIIAFTRSLAKEVAAYGVRVNAIAPGFIDTDMTGDLSEKYLDKIPLKRVGASEEIAKLVTFLCSDDCGYIVGEVVRIDGGLTI